METIDYGHFLDRLKSEIRTARLRATLAANAEMLGLYWRMGRLILEQQAAQGWGTKVIDILAGELRREFPDMQGLSPRNLKYMRRFAQAYPDEAFVQASLAQITWYHHITLLEKVKDEVERLVYVQAAAQHGWSRDIMVHQIESGYARRVGQTVNNFEQTLPPVQSYLARQAFKDPYLFDFLALSDDYRERDLENGLVEQLTKFLIELGNGFAYVGRQVQLEVGGQEYFLDLLFYHLRLRAYVVVELKVTDFKPEYAGKLNFYLSAVDDLIRTSYDQPSIGLLICKSRNQVVAEYSLRDVRKPIGIAGYHMTEALPDELRKTLPSIEQLQQTLQTPKSPSE